LSTVGHRCPGRLRILECEGWHSAELEITEVIRGIAVSGGEVYLADDCIGLSIYRHYGDALFLDGFEIGTTKNRSASD